MKIDNNLIQKYNQAAPRYTSYPPANYFSNTFTDQDYVQMLDASNQHQPEKIAFYVHIPFCKQICYYCGCNAIKLHNDSRVEDYISAVKKEISLVKEHLNKDRKISQIHFGGGTPNAIEIHYLKEIIAALSEGFDFIDKPEIAIECHPALLSYSIIDQLVDAGFTRFSLGIQDFNDDVLKAVNRRPSALPVDELVAYLRSKPSTVGVNLDFIYGLPLQTEESFAENIKKALLIQPDRLVTFSYAHVPWLKKHQQILQERGLPDSKEKMKMFEAASQLLTEAGYQPIGFDHFAKPEDELSIALENKQLHRNFQGYCTLRTTGQVYAFGVSGISQLFGGYAQNTKSVDDYISSIERQIFPIEKGLTSTKEQGIIREVISQIMCNHHINWEILSQKLGISTETLKETINYQPEKLQEMATDGLLTFNDQEINVSTMGSFLIRNIAALFDPMFKEGENKYSKTI